MKINGVAHGTGQLSNGPGCTAATYAAAAAAPAATAARETGSASCNRSNPSSPSFSSSTCSFTTTYPSSSSCASSCCHSCSCASCSSCTSMPWSEHDADAISNHDNGNEIKDGGEHDGRRIEDGKREEMQPQRPVGCVTEQTAIPQPSLRLGSFPPSQPTQPAVLPTLSTVGEEAHSKLSTTESPRCSALPPSSLASIVFLSDSPSTSNPQSHADASSVPVPQPAGFRRMPRDPRTGRRICFYFNRTGCSAGARCAYPHTKMDISNITPGTFHKPGLPAAPSSSGLPSFPPSRPLSNCSSYSSWERKGTNRPRHHHSSSFPLGATLPSFPAPLPNYVPPGPPLSLPHTPAYVMSYVGAPPFYSRSLPSSHTSSLPNFFHGGAPPPVRTVLVGDRGERMLRRWGDVQWYLHQMQPGQQAAYAMEEEWVGGLMMDVRIFDMQPHAYYQQHYHYYPYLQMLQQEEQEGQEVQGEERQ